MNIENRSGFDEAAVSFMVPGQLWFKSVTIIGLGYIGLPTATLIASRGTRVNGVDISRRVVETINGGRCHFEEFGLETMVTGVVKSGLLSAATTVSPADIFIICVPTPATPDGSGNKICDLSYVLGAADAIAPNLAKGNLVVLESTSPIGASERVSARLAELRPDLSFPHQAGEASDIAVSYCPERVIPGRMITELVENDRVIGGMTSRCAEKAAALYRTFVAGECYLTKARVAEAVKLTENSFRDVNIAFANELSMLCDGLDIDVRKVIALANRHPRVDILTPGPGVGGHCIPVDPWFLWESMPERAPLIRTARNVNDEKTHFVVRQILAEQAKTGGTIACLGLTYKADVDDFRESPALEIVEALYHALGDKVIAVDPYADMMMHVMALPKFQIVSNVTAAANADIVVTLVGHKVFRTFEPHTGQVVIDICGLFANARQAAKA